MRLSRRCASYDRGVRGFWFTDAQFMFIPAWCYIEDAKELLRVIKAEGLTGIRWAAYIRQGLIKPGYNPISMMPWTARMLLWNPEAIGPTFGQVCLEAFDRNLADFGCTVMCFKLAISIRNRNVSSTIVDVCHSMDGGGHRRLVNLEQC